MDSPIMFKSAVGGFDKKAVISYIFELNENSQAAQKKLTAQLEEVTQAREALDKQLAEQSRRMQKLQADLEGLTSELSGEKARTGELTNMVDELNAEIKRLRAQLAQKEEEAQNVSQSGGELNETIEGLRAEIERQRAVIARKEEEARNISHSGGQMNETIEGLRAEIERQRALVVRKEEEARNNLRASGEFAKKQAEIDRVSTQLGKLMLEAKTDAEHIRADAQMQAEGIVADAHYKAKGIIGNADRSISDVRRQFADFRAEIAGVQQDILSAVDTMRQKAEYVGDLMDSAEQRLLPDNIADSSSRRVDSSGGFFRSAGEK